MRWLRPFLCILVLGLGACGGGGAVHSPVPAAGAAGGVSANTSIALGPTATTAALPIAAGIAGTIAFPAVDTATTLDLSTSAAPPPGVALQSIRRTRSHYALDIYEYITLAPKTTISLPMLPALTFTFPAGVAVSGRSVCFGITDPVAQPGALAAFETNGPAKVVGQRATIGAVARPLVLQAGHRYTFIVYAISVPSSVTTPTIYVANTGIGSVTTYRADGTLNVPAITSGLQAPQAVAVGPTGTTYVLDSNTDAVTSYAPNGTRTPLTIALPRPCCRQGSVYLGLDVGPDGTIDVPQQHCGDGNGCYFSVLRFAPDGTTRPSIGIPYPPGIRFEAVDAAGNIDVMGVDGTVTRYSADGTTHTQVVSGLQDATAIAVDAAGRLYLVVNQRISSYNADGSQRGLTISLNFVPGPIAVDAGGKIYVVDPGDTQIVSYNADGSVAAPTITTGSASAGIAVH